MAKVLSVLDEIGPSVPRPLVRLTDSPGSWAMPGRLRARPRLWISRATVDAGPLALSGEVAHELAHLVEPRRDRSATMPLGAALSLSALSFTVISLPQRISTGSPALWALAPAWLVSVAAAAAAVWLVCRVNHAREFRADRTAARLLGSTAPVRTMLTRIEADYVAQPWRHRLASRLTHPDPARRLRALQALTEELAEVTPSDDHPASVTTS